MGDGLDLRIAHISDPHFESPFFSEELARKALRKLNNLELDLIVCTGDLTVEGLIDEFKRAKEFFSNLSTHSKLIIPGNHDARNVGFEVFTEFFGERWKTLEKGGIRLFGADSSQPDLDDGHIGRENYRRIHNYLKDAEFSVFALHHHLVPLPKTGRERSVTVDSGDVLKLLVDADVDLVLSGHRHIHWLWDLEGITILHAGALATRRVKGREKPSFNVIDIGKKIVVHKVVVEESETEKIFEKKIKRK
ncbi:MAG: 3'5'-cyclic AMP phosphodiesterase CpdA [Candidatus Methanohalarchaeum thermophilum]|uniref:3'5'-cyclic AMP phosphodiesterase CpdA n=1 Tax=Methanohalarchaeum thermophilum TaxID=1903181 RepID=A0A1Q6DWF0_METT1|nr:MAG: 3'5'-cyclic AMP phosphodiesterase CpdA [Candidatus Methanohalarchaeum thermophilum]